MSLDLTGLLSLIEEMPAYRRLVKAVEQKKGNTSVAVLEAAKPYLLASLYHRLRVPMLVVTAHAEGASRLYEQLLVWTASNQVKLFPEPDILPYEHVTFDNITQQERLRALSALANVDNNKSTTPPLVIASAPAFIQKVMPYQDFRAAGKTISLGMEVAPFQLLGQWQTMGYRMENMVEVPGTMSHRGGIVDVYPPTSDSPARLEFFGDTVESIRLFDPVSQKSLSTVSSIAVGPAIELSLTDTGLIKHSNILHYLPEEALLVLDEPSAIKLTAEDWETKADELLSIKDSGQSEGLPKPYFTWEELEPSIRENQCLQLTMQDEPDYRLSFSPATSYAGQLPLLIKKTKEIIARKHRIIIVSHQSRRISELLEEADVIAPALTEVRQAPPPGSLTLLQGLLAEGWVMNRDIQLFTDAEIFGFVKQSRPIKKRPISRHRLFVDMAPGDYVVHVEHGIARFTGVTKMKADSLEKEYLVLQYAVGDKLYVPTDQINRVSRYIGAGEGTPALSRLGTQEWTRSRQKVSESVAKMAQELLALYAAREIVPGFAYSPDTVWQQEVEAAFPYVETPDQLEVQKQVKADMEKTRPMDRLVCGDVGYGKTEVAVRAAFKAVMDGKQVAVLVPTTVLAQQHFVTFNQRLAAFPIKVEVLSRFRTEKEQAAVIEGLANGSVDICIGTHRLLQKDVAFKDLGLLIIDEEQRFGVAHKEHLKRMKQQVDVLTLSATPIPRTLHMSLVGVRDMSVMETPPEERLPVKTYVAEYNDRLVREAILRELERNGQVFFVHNRVQSIDSVAATLQELVPEARIAIAHGQMPEAQLEEVMAGFIEGKSDVLLCTTIIESGLDMPNANTMIVNNADKFGLTQLYQLRGRIGRGAHLAFAYFLYEKGKRLPPIAEKRLKTIFEATELGAGFSIAMKDMEIRGAGNLLGARQSGHISAVGFNLYCQLLAQAVEEQKAKLAGRSVEEVKLKHLPPPTIDLPLPAYIPEDYVTDLNTRLGLYQKLVKLERIEQLESLSREFTDRFGAPPPEIGNLLYALKIKILAAQAGIASVSTVAGEITLRRFEGMRFDKKKLDSLPRHGIEADALHITLHPKRLGKDWQKMLEEVMRRIS